MITLDEIDAGFVVMSHSIKSTTKKEKEDMYILASSVYIEYFQGKLPIDNFGVFASAILFLLGKNVSND